MMPGTGRRGHRKSKNGCYQCKMRKVKCDETKPSCNNCTRHAQPGSRPCLYNSAPVTRVQSSSEPPRNTSYPSTPAPITNFQSKSHTPSPSLTMSPLATLSSTPKNHNLTVPDILVTSNLSSHMDLRINQLHMRLLHIYSTSTSVTLARNPVLQNIWRIHVPELAFASDYVMHSVLSLASLHIAFCRPEEKDQYINYALQLHEAALRTATAILANVTDDNSPALYTFAALSFFISWAMPPKSDGLWFMGDGLGSDGMVIFRGTRTIIESTKGRPSTLASRIGPLFRMGNRRRRARDSIAVQIHEPLVALQALFIESILDPDILRIYTAAIEELSRSFTMVQEMAAVHGGFSETSDVFAWLFVVSDEYLDLLSQRTQESLVIFGHFCVLLKNLEWAWWMSKWSLQQVSSIYHHLLDFEHQAWMQWPMEQLGWIPV